MSNTKFVSQKYNNYQYAPGIALYGVDGKAGVSGTNGTSLFICIYDIQNDEDRGKFGNAIRHGNTMTTEEPKSIGRNYTVGDSFLFPDGKIYSIKKGSDDNVGQYLNILISAGDNLTPDEFDECMEYVGRIRIENQNDRFQNQSNRLVLDTDEYKGFVINNSDSDDIGNVEAPLTIIGSTKTGTNGIEPYLDIKSIQTGMSDAQFKIYYDENNSTYVIDSDRPIRIDADLKVKSSSSSANIAGYSSISVTDTPITSFKGVCEKTTYTIDNGEVEYDYSATEKTCQVYNHDKRPENKTSIESSYDGNTYEDGDNCRFWWYDAMFTYITDEIEKKKVKQICVHTFVKQNTPKRPLILEFTKTDSNGNEVLADVPCIDIMSRSELVNSDSDSCLYYKSEYFYVPSEADKFIIIAPDAGENDFYLMVYENGAPAQSVDSTKEETNHTVLSGLFNKTFPLDILRTATARYIRTVNITFKPEEKQVIQDKWLPKYAHIKGIIGQCVDIEFYVDIKDDIKNNKTAEIKLESYRDIMTIDTWMVSLIGISEIEIRNESDNN